MAGALTVNPPKAGIGSPIGEELDRVADSGSLPHHRYSPSSRGDFPRWESICMVGSVSDISFSMGEYRSNWYKTLHGTPALPLCCHD